MRKKEKGKKRSDLKRDDRDHKTGEKERKGTIASFKEQVEEVKETKRGLSLQVDER